MGGRSLPPAARQLSQSIAELCRLGSQHARWGDFKHYKCMALKGNQEFKQVLFVVDTLNTFHIHSEETKNKCDIKSDEIV